MDKVIVIENLHKSFGAIHAVNDLSFQVKKGELFAFLGENGAGKSTTISMICGQLSQDSGRVTVCGAEPDKSKEKLGVVFQSSVLDGALTVRDNLQSRAALYGIGGKAFQKRIQALSELLHLEEIMDRTVSKLSGGQRRRADIARALLHKPEILVLDEPTTGLDPQTRKMLWDVLAHLRKEEHLTVFLTTHYMEEAADADFVVILDRGRSVAEGTPLQLKNAYTGDFITLYGVTQEQVQKLGKPFVSLRDGYRVQVENTAQATALIGAFPHLFVDFEITKGKMDDVFLAVTGKKIEGGAAQ